MALLIFLLLQNMIQLLLEWLNKLLQRSRMTTESTRAVCYRETVSPSFSQMLAGLARS